MTSRIPSDPHNESETRQADRGTGRERCLDYLLGEMTAAQSAEFESDLLDPALARSLVLESELLCRLATAEWFPCIDNRSNDNNRSRLDRSLLDRQFHEAQTAGRSPALSSGRSTLRKLISALAASLLIAASGMWYLRFVESNRSQLVQVPPSNDPADFELELAKTLVQPAIEWPTNESTVDWNAGVGVEELDGSLHFDESSGEEPVSEESIDWIVAAVKASMSEGQLNDG